MFNLNKAVKPDMFAPSHAPHLLHATAVIAGALLLSCSTAYAETANSVKDHNLSLCSGTVIPVILNEKLSSSVSLRGDKFTCSIDSSKAAYDNLLHGATISGVVRKVVISNGAEPGTISLAFTSIKLEDGTKFPINGSLSSLESKRLYITNTGLLESKIINIDNHKRLSFAGIGSGAGALVSKLDNGNYKVEGILGGGDSGYSVDSILTTPTTVHNVDLLPGTTLGVFLGDPVGFNQMKRETMTPRSRRTYMLNETKYYWYEGQAWAMDMASGERYHVADNTPLTRTTTGKYYNYRGHFYYVEPDTGVRTQLD